VTPAQQAQRIQWSSDKWSKARRDAMRRSCLTWFAIALFAAMSSRAFAADIAGTVVDSEGNPVKGIHIAVEDASGNVVGQADPDAKGQYSISGLPAGTTYSITLIPLMGGFQGQTVQSGLGPEGLCVDWALSKKVAALATARPGASAGICAPSGLAATGPAAPAAAGNIPTPLILGSAAAVIAGGAIGGVAAGGGFSGSGGSGGGGGGGKIKIASPSQ